MKATTRRNLALLFAFVLVLTILAGCAAKSADEPASAEYAAAEEPAYEAEAEPMEPAAEESAEYALAASGEGSDLTAETSEAPANGKPSLADKIIYSGYMYIETTKFDEAVAAVDAKVKEFGGFIESSNINGRTEYRPDGTTSLVDRNASYVVRVPSAKFDAFVKQSGSLGNVLSSNTSAENITSQFTDAEARKDSLKVQEERLLAMMEKTDNIKSLIELEERLTEVRYEYEAIERKLINWQNQVDYSSINLNLQEVAIYTPVVPVQRTFGEKLGSALSDGWNGFVRFIQAILIGLAGALPALILLALLALILVLILRSAKRKSKAKREALYAKSRPVPTAVAVPAEPKPEEKSE
jgi:hypothetical protein